MVRIYKPGKIVIMLKGRHAGKKGVVLQQYDEGAGSRHYGHALVAGIEKGPKRVTSGMSKSKAAKRLRVKPFLKVVNYTHMLPTRYALQNNELADTIPANAVKDPKKRMSARATVKKHFEDRVKAGVAADRWFFTRLRF
eukprot:TRINITY_DN7115_c0_g1_i2.p2 TRINITY_DN7115_c0_g1~~TRINITY_DN7115_c0_g1_i2.p2  ORF type:complete len:139 (+),score=27.97 TRINITY_DN7115_c0_g1_i2:22-438(+)